MMSRLASGFRRFSADRRGNVALLFALAAVPLMLGMGAAVDYARAAKVRGELAAICDSAVLTATTPTMMAQTSAIAQAAAQTAFASAAQAVNGLTYNANALTVVVNDTQQTGFVQRTASVTYAATVQNAFGALDFMPTTSFTVTASVSTSAAPNVDTYVLVDNSPSMELPATTAGVQAMAQFGCAFACHEKTTNDGEYIHPYTGWGTAAGSIDSYTYAENNGITLRIDNVREAVKNIATTANTFMTQNGASYRMGVYGFNYTFTTLQPLIATTSGNLSTIQASVSNLIPPLMDSNNYLAANLPYVYPTASGLVTANPTPTSPVAINDAMTDFTNAMTQINTIMPNPGNGASAAGDTPQGLLIVVTDGMVDMSATSAGACGASATTNSYSNGYGTFTRCIQPIDTTMCTTVKNRGIRIAVLYTTYQMLDNLPAGVPSQDSNGASFYASRAKVFADSTIPPSQISRNLQACASSPALFQEVTTDQDINAAMQSLYARAISSAPRLTQ